MVRFSYQVRDAMGHLDAGVLTANDLGEASRLLRKDGRVIVSLETASSAEPQPATTSTGGGRVKKDDIIFFATQLAVMVETGVPLVEALDACVEQCDKPGLRAVLDDVAQQVKSGIEFSAALGRHPKVFSNLFVAMMKASEASGTMGTMLQRVSEYMQTERDTIKKIKGAMTYPVCMLSFCALVVVALLVFVLPKFEKIYSGKGAVLPLPTRILLGMSNGILAYWPIILAVLAVAVGGGVFYFRSAGGKIFLDRVRISLPIVGPMFRKAYLARSLRTMATMVSTGVSILDGLAITAQVAGNHFFSQVWYDLAERAKEGSSLSDQLFENKLIPRTVSQMISAGERSGRLGMVMNRVAGFCEDELSVSVKTVTTMIEPMMIIVMGLLVGGIAMALLLPVFSISKVVAH